MLNLLFINYIFMGHGAGNRHVALVLMRSQAGYNSRVLAVTNGLLILPQWGRSLKKTHLTSPGKGSIFKGYQII